MNQHLDFETRSELDLKVVGVAKYAAHPSTQITCLTIGPSRDKLVTLNALDYGFDWDWDNIKLLADIVDDVQAGLIIAHNAPFEDSVYHHVLHLRYGWPARVAPKLWGCTMSRAAMVGLPLDLDTLGKVLKLSVTKDVNGRAAMQRSCKPIGRDPLTGKAIFDESRELYARLCAYNRTDVVVEIGADEKLPQLPPMERAIWEHDLTINRRGVAVDLTLADRAAQFAEKLTDDLNRQLKEKTGGYVDKATQVAAMQRYLAWHGVIATSLDKENVTDFLADAALPERAREVLVIRRQVGKSSTAKYAKTISAAGDDGRVRGVLQYHAAHTGRWGGRLIQPQNYPKGFDEAEQTKAVDAILRGTPESFAQLYGIKAMDALSDVLRGTIVAAPGKTLMSADFNAIEARGLFWEAGDALALDCYRRGDSPYVDMARYIYSDGAITKKTHPKQYDIGKRVILGCGFGMGHKKFKKTVKTQANTDISLELAQRAVKAYREKYSSVKNMWYEVERAAVAAVKVPGSIQPCMGGKVAWAMSRDRQYLVARLPSGRWLWYYKPEVKMLKREIPQDDPGAPPLIVEKETLCFWGEDPKTKQWVLLRTYGGALVENITQAIARDVMAAGMAKCEAAGYPIILTVHDELLAEVETADLESGKKSLEEFMRLMCDLPAWANGFPVAAEGWTGARYRK